MQIVPYSHDLAARIAGLFPADPPVPTRLWANLDGTIHGRILVDEPAKPTVAFLQDLAEGPTYLGGALSPDILRDGFAILRAYQEVVVCLWPDDPLLAMLPGGNYYAGVAIDFWDRSPTVDLDRLAVLPEGYTMRQIDSDLAHRVEGFAEYYGSMYGSVERAVEGIIGHFLMHGDAIVSEAEAGPLTRGVAEMGIETEEAYRRQGFATIAAAYVIRACEAQGYHVFWNAAQLNAGSVALARRLGFRRERPSAVLAWAAGPTSAPGAGPPST